VKSFLINIDRALFGNACIKYYATYKARKILTNLSSELAYSYTVSYDKNKDNVLSILCDKYGSDKGSVKLTSDSYSWMAHTYADYYHDIFFHCRKNVTKVFECGIGTNNPSLPSSMGICGKPGASLRVWRDYFTNAEIIGVDIDKDILFSEERISTFCVDQTSKKSIEKMWNMIRTDDFDLMIDDGLHTFEAGVCLFQNSIDKLSSTGIYVIEDVTPRDLMRYKNYFFKLKYETRFINLYRPNTHLFDNSLVIIQV
jgi:hypothetical protein